jgi:hypothetical protein
LPTVTGRGHNRGDEEIQRPVFQIYFARVRRATDPADVNLTSIEQAFPFLPRLYVDKRNQLGETFVQISGNSGYKGIGIGSHQRSDT